jgi:phage-related minor tail protein
VATGTPLAAAFVRIRPDASGLQRETEREFGRAGQQAGQTFSRQFGDTARRSGESESAGQQAGRKFGGAFADSVKIAAGIAIAKIGELASQQLVAGFTQALDLSGAQGLFQAQLGVSAKEAGKIGAVAGKLFSNAYGENMEEVNAAITSVVQNMDGMKGASAGALEDITARALTTSKVLGEDVGGVTRAVSQLMKTGLAPNAKEAFDLINKGAQNGINVAGDLLDTVSEYSTQFREVGLSGPRAFGLIQQALKGGARDADTAADAIKEFAIRSQDGSATSAAAFKTLGLDAKTMFTTFAKGGPDADKAFNTVITRLKGMKSPTDQTATAVQLFGTKAEDLQDALFALNPATAEQALGKLAGTTDTASKAMGETAQARFETFKRTLQTSVVNFLATEVIPAIEKFNGFLGNIGVSGTGLAVTAGAVAGIGIAAKGASMAVSGISAGISGIKTAAGAVSSTAQATGRLAQGFRSAQVAQSAFSGTAGTFGGKLRTAYNAAATGARTFATAALSGARAAATAAASATSAALAHTRAGIAAAAAATRTLLAAAAQRTIALATKAWAIAQVALNIVLSANPIGLIVLAIGALVAAVVLAYKNSETFRRIVDAAFRGIAAAGKWMWENVLKIIFNAIKFYIMNILVPYYKMLWNVAKAVFKGIAEAGKFMWDKVIKPIWNAIKWYIQTILIPYYKLLWTAAKTAFGGIVSAGKTLWNALSGIFSRIKSGVSAVGTAFGRGASAIKSGFDKIRGYTKAPVNFVIGTVFNKGILGLWNKVMGWLHLPESLRLKPVQMLASGGAVSATRAGKRGKPTAIVGEGNPNHPEYVIPTDPKYRGRAMSLWQAAGQNLQMMKSGGIMGFIEKAAGKVKNIGGAALDLITNPGKVWDSLVKKLPSWDHLKSSPFGTAIGAIPTDIMKRARGYALSFLQAFSSGFGGSNGDVVKAALKYIGVGDDRGVDNNNMFTRHYGWPSGTPWCALFVSKAIEDAKAKKRYPGAPTAAVATFNSRMRHVPVGSGRPGDLATYGSNDHVNLIIKKMAGGYDTVGGNQGPRVNRYVRGGQATVLRPLASGGMLSSHIKEVFRQQNLDKRDKANPLLNGYRGMQRPMFDSGGFGQGWPFHPRKPEPVFSNAQWKVLEKVIAGGQRQVGPFYITGLPSIPPENQIAGAIDRTLTIRGGRW